MISAIDRSERIVTSTITYPEARAALARKRREGNLDDSRHQQATINLDQDWLASTHMEVSEQLSYHGGILAERYALRGYDSVHLATALRFAKKYEELSFLAFDLRLNQAARAESLAIYGDDEGTSIP